MSLAHFRSRMLADVHSWNKDACQPMLGRIMECRIRRVVAEPTVTAALLLGESSAGSEGGVMAITTEPAPRVPLLPGMPILGAAVELRRDFLGTTLRAAREVGDIARIVAGPPGWRITLYSVSTPELVFEILGHPDRFTKDVPSYRELRWALGNGMLTSEGEDWHRQRRFLAPFFTPKRIATSYAPVMAEEATTWVERRRPAAAERADRGRACGDDRPDLADHRPHLVRCRHDDRHPSDQEVQVSQR